MATRGAPAKLFSDPEIFALRSAVEACARGPLGTSQSGLDCERTRCTAALTRVRARWASLLANTIRRPSGPHRCDGAHPFTTTPKYLRIDDLAGVAKTTMPVSPLLSTARIPRSEIGPYRARYCRLAGTASDLRRSSMVHRASGIGGITRTDDFLGRLFRSISRRK